DMETKRRYSEFESLRKALTLLYPALIVPPIPEKHSLVDYAALSTRVRDDLPMVEKRKRMLQTFLNRVAKHPELGKEHVFHRFLESHTAWSDVLHSPPLSTLPKNPLQMIVSKQLDLPTHTYHPVLSSNLIPTPSAAYQLRQPDPRFEESEKFTFRIANYMSNNLDKSQRKVIRRLGELANDYAELGAVYNGFSLNETGAVANAIEKIGQAVDASYTETGHMVTSLEGEFAEPIQEHAQFAQIIKQVLKFRHMKHVQTELIENALNHKKENLDSLLRMENEARRLEEAMTRERTIGANAIDVDEPYGVATPPSTTTPSSPVRTRNNWTGMHVISAVGHTLQNIIDVNPEATRRNQIGMSKDAIGVLQEAL
ncbi:Autophagy-protein 20, partial [Rhizopus stolonifer]